MNMKKHIFQDLVPQWCVLLLLILGLGLTSVAQAQGKDDSTTTKKQVKASLDEGVLIDLGEIQIVGEIAQPNVVFINARQEPLFRELSLRRTPAEGLTNLDVTAQDRKSSAATRIKNWTEMLDRPRD